MGRVAHPIVRIVREPVGAGEIPERRDARNLIKRLREILRQVAALDGTMERTDSHDKLGADLPGKRGDALQKLQLNGQPRVACSTRGTTKFFSKRS